MAKKKIYVYPGEAKQLAELGQRLKDARPRRRFSMETVCARAGISRTTLYKVENGDASTAFGHYVQVLRILSLLDDLSFLAKEDALGRKLQDESMPQRKRAPRSKGKKDE